jgi:hypothetical protein
MKLFNRYYEFEKLALDKTFVESIDLLFIGNSKELRAQKVPAFLKENFKGRTFSINYDIEFEKYSLLEIQGAYTLRDEDLNSIGKDLVSEFINDLKKIELDDKTILIDITSLKHPLLFYFILVLKKQFSPKKLFITYTEPEKYDKIKTDEIEDTFDLTERFCEVNSLPGYLRISDYTKERLLVASMGFEGARFNKAFGDINPASRKTYSIVGFPSFHPNWQYYVYSKNKAALSVSKASKLLKRTTANEPFGIYNVLKSIYENNREFELVIAPLGTKPHSLGVTMFAVDHEDVMLYYDFPAYGKKIRTIGVGKSAVFNLTDFIND